MVIKYNTARNRFEAEWAYSEHRTAHPVVKGAGFAFDGTRKHWHSAGYGDTPKSMAEQKAIACKLWDYLDAAAQEFIGAGAEAIRASIAAQDTHKQVSLEASRATDSLGEVPSPAGLSYLPFQKAGIAYASSRPNTLIADEMGLGKTIQAIGLANVLNSGAQGTRRVLVICPATLKINWLREWKKWDISGLSVGIAQAGEPFPTTDVVIVNFDLIGEDIVKKSRGKTITIEKFNAEVKAFEWDLLIVDECHKVKNPDAIRTQFILGKKASKRNKLKADILPIPAKRRIFMTGTPICNRPIELWPIVEALDPTGLGASFWKFAQRYCAAVQGRFGWDFKGASNLNELQERLRSTIMVRRLKADVLKDLPAKRRQVLEVEPDSDGRDLIEKEKLAYENYVASEGDSIALAEMSKMRHEVALYKMPFVIKQVDEMLEDGGLDKIVVMAHHKDVAEGIRAHFGTAAVLVHGDKSMADRQASVDRFQTDPTCKVFVGTIMAAGVGLTLTAASTVVFAELDWTPGNVSQAEDRCHRIGQTDAVYILHVVLDESLDAKMINMIIDKQAIADAALDNVKAPVQVEMPPVGAPEPKAEAARKPVTIKTKAGEVTVKLTPEQIAATHTGLKMLRSRCDGAHDQDGMGFSGADVQFGWSLAAAPNLTMKQAAHGQRLIRKYQGQLPEELVLAAGVERKA